MAHPYPNLDREISIRNLVARNRVMMSTHGPRLSQPRYIRYLEERARGGIGLAGFNLGPLGLMQFPFGPGIPGASWGVDLDGVPPHPLTAAGSAFYDSMMPTMREWQEAVSRHGVRTVGQLYHPGAAQHSDNFQPVVSASALVDEFERHRPHVLTGLEIADLIEAYARSARRAVQAGYDAVEIHAAHGYLVQQFLSPLLNQRSDQWGGSFANRTRFLLAVIVAVREATDDVIPVGIRLTGPEPEGGLMSADIAAISAAAEAAGASYISLSGGTYSGLWRGAGQAYVASALTPPGPNVDVAAAVSRAVKIPVMVGGSIATLRQAEAIVADGAADIVCMVRALMADAALVAKGFGGGAAARPCIGGNECHYGRPVACAVNPATGREAVLDAGRAAASRSVIIVGAGPAGLECAIAAAGRGHDVTLMDREDRVGGMLAVLAPVSQQARFADYINYARNRIAELGVRLQLCTEATGSGVRALAPDVLVLATGAVWRPSLGIAASIALREPERCGPRVTIVGGTDDHLGPLIVADYMARTGRQVTLLVEGGAPGQAVEAASLYAMMRHLYEQDVTIVPFSAAAELRDGALQVRNTLTNALTALQEPGDLIDVGGRVADAPDWACYGDPSLDTHMIGDALSPRRMLHATLDGARLGLQI